jgi:uncharacterized protein
MSPLFLLAGAGLMAGMMNALAGGGSFVTLPALIAAGVPSVYANTTSTVALYPGQLTSSWAYRDGLGPIGSVPLRSLVIVTFIGGALGAVLLLRTPIKTFDVVLPWLMAIATVALALGSRLGELLRRRWRIGATAVLGVRLLSDRTLKSFNAPRTLLVSAANAIAVLIFVAARAVHWREALIMLATAILGAYFGSRIGRRAPAGVIRVVTVWLSIGITLAFFARGYLK